MISREKTSRKYLRFLHVQILYIITVFKLSIILIIKTLRDIRDSRIPFVLYNHATVELYNYVNNGMLLTCCRKM